MKKNSIILSMFLLFMIAGQVIPVFSITPRLEVSAQNIYLSAGKLNPITIILNNTGDFDLQEIEAILISSVPGISVITNSHKVWDIITYDDNLSYHAILYVDQNIALGTYTLQLQLNYIRGGRPTNVNVPISVIVSEAFQPSIKITVKPETQKFKTNYSGNFNFTIVNLGNVSIKDVTIILSQNSPLFVITGNQLYAIDEITAGKTKDLSTTIKILESAQLGPYSITATIYYSDLDGNRVKQVITLPFEITSYEITKSPILVMRNLNASASIIPGMAFKQVVKIECSEATAYNIKAQLSLDVKGQLTPLGPTIVAIGDMQTNDSKIITFELQLDGSALPGPISTTLTLRYIDQKGIQSTVSETIVVNVDQLVNFRLLDENPKSLQRGKTSKLEADILLIGTTRVEFVSLNIEDSGPVQITSGSEYLGAVDPDSPVPFTISVDVPTSTSLGEYKFKTKITYFDNNNNFKDRYIEIPIKIIEATTTQTTTNDGGFWGWIRSLLGWT